MLTATRNGDRMIVPVVGWDRKREEETVNLKSKLKLSRHPTKVRKPGSLRHHDNNTSWWHCYFYKTTIAKNRYKIYFSSLFENFFENLLPSKHFALENMFRLRLNNVSLTYWGDSFMNMNNVKFDHNYDWIETWRWIWQILRKSNLPLLFEISRRNPVSTMTFQC